MVGKERAFAVLCIFNARLAFLEIIIVNILIKAEHLTQKYSHNKEMLIYT